MDAKEFTALLTDVLVKRLREFEEENPDFKAKYADAGCDIGDYNDLNNDGVPMNLVEDDLADNETISTDKGIIKFEKSVGGYEGGGDYVQYVLSITQGDKKEYFACEGRYITWEGTLWEGYNFYKVEPQKEVINNYIPVQSK